MSIVTKLPNVSAQSRAFISTIHTTELVAYHPQGNSSKGGLRLAIRSFSQPTQAWSFSYPAFADGQRGIEECNPARLGGIEKRRWEREGVCV